MDHGYTLEKPTLEERCEYPQCERRSGFRVTIVGGKRNLCGPHTGDSLRTALAFGLPHRSVRLGFEDEFREWI